jgi:hypothetical protein
MRSALVLLVVLVGCSCTETPAGDRDAATDISLRDRGPAQEGSVDAPGDGSAPDAAQKEAGLGDLQAPGDLKPSGDAGQPGLVLRVTFDQAPLGAYTDSAIRSEWKWIKWHSGLKEGRVHIVDGAQAKSGRSLRISYPKNTFGPGQGGAQWWVTLPKSYSELYCAYWIKFGSGFDFVKGGKIPGLLGGKGNTGGNKPDGTDGWSARMMWRKSGDAVQYLYHPDQPGIYGEDLAWDIGSKRVFKPGDWVRVEHRIVINTPGKKDGIVEGWWNGQLALSRKNVRFRDVSSFAIDGFYFSTFFGGGDSSWASSKDEVVYFDDVVIATQPITH